MTAARKTSAKGNPNRKRTWVAPTVPRLAVNPRWVALRTVWAAAAMMVKKAHSHDGSSIARLLGGHHVVHVHVAGDPPAVGEKVVDHSGLIYDREAADLQRGRELVGGNELFPAMSAPRQPAQHIFCPHNSQCKALERAVDGGDQHDTPGLDHFRTSPDE